MAQMLSSQDVDLLLQQLARLKAERGTLDAHLQEIAEVMKPMQADFNIQRAMGEKRQQKIFDSTAGLAGDNLGSGLYGMISNPANVWFTFRHEDDQLNDVDAVRDWLSDVAKRMANQLAGNGGRFYTKVLPLYQHLAFFGTGVFYNERVEGRAEIFHARKHLKDCYIVENAYEQVDTVFLTWKWTAQQAKGYFAPKGIALPEIVEKSLTKEPGRCFEFVNVVRPNEFYRAGLLGPRGMRFASIWILVEEKKLLKESGFPRFPYQVPRWTQAAIGPYGDSPAMLALPDVKMLNAFRKVNLIGAQKVVDPTILAADEQPMRGWNAAPGGIIYGGLDDLGRRRYEPMLTGGRPDIGVEYEEKIRESIRDAFFFSLLLMAQAPNRTATEVLEQQQEKLRQMAPHLGRIQSEFLDPLLDWMFAEMMEQGAFPPPPDELLEYPAINVEYVSPLARAQKAGEGTALVRSLQALEPLGTVKPEVWDNIDADAATRAIWDAFGADTKVLTDPRVVAQQRAQRAQEQDLASMMASAAPVSGAVKNLAQAGQVMTAARGA